MRACPSAFLAFYRLVVIFRFLEGTYEVKVGDKFFTAEPGAVAVVLPGHAHAFRNIGERDARLQYIIMPGASSDEFFPTNRSSVEARRAGHGRA